MGEHSTPTRGDSFPRAAVAPGGARGLAGGTALGTVAALVGTSAVYGAAQVAELDLVVTTPGGSTGEVPYAAVLGAVAASAIVAFVGAVVLRRLHHGRRWFMALATLALLGSFAPPVGAAEAPSTAAVLSVMHVVVWACVIPLVARRMGVTR